MTYLPPLEPFVLLENSRDADGGAWLFEMPRRIVRCEAPSEIDASLEAIEAGIANGLYAAGWLSYEVGSWIEPKLQPTMPAQHHEPLIWIGLFPKRQRLDRHELDAFWHERSMGRSFQFSEPILSLDQPAFCRAVEEVHGYLAAGDVYQINLTMEATGSVEGDPLALHAALRLAQPVVHGAFISSGDWCVSSHSPELFFSLEGDTITVKPMKGTLARGRTREEDVAAASHLCEDPKSQAENLMIVDLERNDLSRMTVPGTVVTETLFEVEALPTALQMTSTVSARLPDRPGFCELIEAIFPCGSVTGAPKIRAMEIIAELEARPRGVYTGAIGQITPAGDGRFSVPIRTLAIDRAGGYRFGVGAGIVADSDAAMEYDECLLKAAFLTAPRDRPALIETLLWEPQSGYWLLDGHLDRLTASASYFGYPLDADAVRQLLADHAASLPITGRQRVRLLVAPTGDVSISSQALAAAPDADDHAGSLPTIAWASCPIRSDDVYLFHKTSRRELYDRAMAAAARNGHWDLLFVNEKGEVTEGARSTLFIERGGILTTPQIESGVLPGVLRNHLLADRARKTATDRIHKSEVGLAQRIYMGNAVHGLVQVRLTDEVIEI